MKPLIAAALLVAACSSGAPQATPWAVLAPGSTGPVTLPANRYLLGWRDGCDNWWIRINPVDGSKPVWNNSRGPTGLVLMDSPHGTATVTHEECPGATITFTPST